MKLSPPAKTPAPGSRPARKHARKAAAGAVTAALLGAAALAMTPSTAMAATSSAGGYCGVFGSGEAGETPNVTLPGVWTALPGQIWTKPADSCRDLNLTWASRSEMYDGWYMAKDGAWVEGSRGNVWHTTNHYLTVLVSDVAPGTWETVTDLIGFNYPAQVWVNY